MKRILTVDDQPLVLRVLRLALEKAGYEVDTAPNGEQALNKIMQQAPDVLITDIEMPRMNGQQLCQRLETDLPNRSFPIFVLTSVTALEHREWSDAIRDLLFLEKPVSARNLVATLASYFATATLPTDA